MNLVVSFRTVKLMYYSLPGVTTVIFISKSLYRITVSWEAGKSVDSSVEIILVTCTLGGRQIMIRKTLIPNRFLLFAAPFWGQRFMGID